MIAPRYLGDGVYASFDGYSLCLHLGRHDSEPAVVLEPEVMAALIKYRDDVARAASRGPGDH